MSDKGARAVERAAIARRKLEEMDHSDLGSSGFWIGQVMMVIATVVGVYLAAHTGLQQALAFDQIKTLQDNYYLRHSLHAELSDNVDTLDGFRKEVLANPPSASTIRRRLPELERYVWETMQFSDTTMETPSHMLNEARRFHRDADAILAHLERGTYGPSHAAEQIRSLTRRMRDRTLPALARSADGLEQRLLEHDADFRSVKKEPQG